MDVGLRHADAAERALAALFALGGPADIAAVWVDGEPVGGEHVGGEHVGSSLS